MEKKKVQWLRSAYQEVPQECPHPKLIKLSDVPAQVEKEHPPRKLSYRAVSHIVHIAFPNAEIKMAGKSHAMHIYGLTPVHGTMQEKSGVSQAAEASSSSQQLMPASVSALLESEHIENKQLKERIVLLEARVQELEQTSLATLKQQADQRLNHHHGSSAVCGPDTPQHFCDFSVDGVIYEFQQHAPDLYRFFVQLGSVQQDDSSDSSTSTKEVKAITSLCILLNTRSRKI